jgi:hypothetical protein
MKLFRELLAKLTRKSPPPAADAEFIYVLIPAPLSPFERGERFEDPLDAELRRAGIGEVSGGGTQLGEDGPDGKPMIAFCGVDVDTTDVAAARALLQLQLVALDCPPGTQIHFYDDNTPLQDRFDGSHWRLGEPREFRHPGFGS